MPVFAHLEGIVHIFIDRAADLEKSVAIAQRCYGRTGVCGAAETLLVDSVVAGAARAAREDAARRVDASPGR